MWYLSSLTRDWTRTPCNEKLQLLLFWCILWSMGYMMMMCVLSRVWLFATPWTVACQAPLSMGFSRQEYWSRLPSPSPGDLPDPGVKPGSLALQADSLLSKPPGKPKMTKSRCGLVPLSQGTFSLKPSLALLAFLLACLLLSHQQVFFLLQYIHPPTKRLYIPLGEGLWGSSQCVRQGLLSRYLVNFSAIGYLFWIWKVAQVWKMSKGLWLFMRAITFSVESCSSILAYLPIPQWQMEASMLVGWLSILQVGAPLVLNCLKSLNVQWPWLPLWPCQSLW